MHKYIYMYKYMYIYIHINNFQSNTKRYVLFLTFWCITPFSKVSAYKCE